MADVEFHVEDRIARVHLNRPAALNAITPDMDDALAAAWTRINDDPAIQVALLTAAGDRAFCAGADIASGLSGKARHAFGGGLTGIGGPLLKLRKPLVAAVRGLAVGGGFELALCADILVADASAQFRLPEVSLGLIRHSGVLHRVMRKLPLNVAMDLILTGRPMLANEALRLGLASRLVEARQLTAAATEICQAICRAPPLASEAAKQAVDEGLDETLEQALGRAYAGIERFAASADAAEAIAALQSKRPPVWSGR